MSIHNESLVSLNPTISGKVILNFNIKSTTIGLNKNKLNIVPFVTPIINSNSPNYDLKFTLNNNVLNLYLHGKKDSVVNWKGNLTIAESN